MEKMYKIFVTCPESHTDLIIEAMSAAGAGIVGNYTHCAYVTKGTGSYKPGIGANPYIGAVGEMSRKPEDKIEMICPIDKLDAAISALKVVHSYETPTIDVIEILFYN